MTEQALPARRSRARWIPVGAALVVVAGFAWSRAGLLGLPAVPAGVNAETAGLSGLDEMRQLDQFVRFGAVMATREDDSIGFPPEGAALVRRGHDAIARGEAETGLVLMQQGLRLEPSNLVLANAYRMAAFRLRREHLRSALRQATLTPRLPSYLSDEPIGLLASLDEEHDTRETKLSLAMAWVDHMLLFPALEVKAPASVEAVDLLTTLIDAGHPGYVPALFARGLNHLHRPARLVWPETLETPKDAAVKDIGTCVAIGRRFDVGSARLRATLAIALGDAYVKIGQLGTARSWWQIAQNLSRDEVTIAAVDRRYAWRDEEILDCLEEELDRSRSELDEPMTDLAFMWN